MKVLDKSECGAILKVSEEDIYLLTMALNSYPADNIIECERLIAVLDEAVYDGS